MTTAYGAFQPTLPTQPYSGIGLFSGWGQPQSTQQMGAYTADLSQYMTPPPAMAGLDAPISIAGNATPAADTAFGFGTNGAGMGGGSFGDWFKNGNNLSAVFQGISALSGAYLGFEQLKQARDALGFQKEAFQANLANQTQSYNTSLEDRINGRTADYEGKEADVLSYLSKHSLKRPGG